MADEYEEGYIHPQEVKSHAKSLERYVYKLFDAFEIPNVYQLSSIKTDIIRINEDAGESYAPYEFRLSFKVTIFGRDFEEIQAYFNALDYIFILLRQRKFVATFFPEKSIKLVQGRK